MISFLHRAEQNERCEVQSLKALNQLIDQLNHERVRIKAFHDYFTGHPHAHL